MVLSAGVPNISEITKKNTLLFCSPSKTPRKGVRKTKGKPVVSQWIRAFEITTPSNGKGEVTSKSKVPSSKSNANIRSIDKRQAKRAPTHSTPGATFDNSSKFGPMAKGKKITIMKKNAKLRPKPPPARTAILKSRRINVIIKKPHLNCLIHLVLIGISKDQLSGHYFLVLDQYELQLLHIHFLKDDL